MNSCLLYTSADSLLVGTLGKPSRFIGNVHMTHENTLMWCDSLYQYELPDSNYLEAFGHVRVIKNDSIRMSGDYMYYDANKKLIQVRRNVTLEDPQMVLTTDFLDYDGLFLSLIHISAPRTLVFENFFSNKSAKRPINPFEKYPWNSSGICSSLI